MATSARAAAAAWLLILAAVACAPHRPPIVPDLASREDRVPVVVVPGITGTELVRARDGRVLWGDGRSLLRPRDGGHSTALPLEDGSAASTVPGNVILELRLLGGLVRKSIYGPVVELLEANGYRLGDLNDPDPGETLFLFAYDWRRSGIDAAAALLERLEALRAARGDDALTVDLIVQSNAAQIGRYLVRYGDAPLEVAEAGGARPPERVHVGKMILVGTAHAGAIRVLHEMNEGRRYIPVVGRKLRPEVFFTFRSLFEALPSGDDVFVDPTGASLPVDVFEPANWRRYGWSVYGRKALRRALREEHRDVFVDRDTIDRYLARALDRAERLHALLGSEPGFEPSTRYYSIQNLSRATPARAVIACVDDGPCSTAFPDDRVVRRDDALQERTTESGDGHATRSSQDALPAGERRRLVGEPFLADARHFELILHPDTQRRILEILAE